MRNAKGEPQGRPSSSSGAASKYAEAMKELRGRSLSWADVGPEELQDAIAHVTEDGAALLFSKTSDGGALMIQALNGAGNKPKFYAVSLGEAHALLEMLKSV